MHENTESIINSFKMYKDAQNNGINLNRNETIDGESVNIYNAILWVLDNSYIPTDKVVDGQKVYNAESYKNELLKKAGLRKTKIVNETTGEKTYDITDDDIEVIQQLAVWYFTNYDEQSDSYSISRTELTVADYLGMVIDGVDTTYDNNMFNGTRGENLNKLYRYFINGAIENNSEYGTAATRITPIGSRTFDKNLELKIEGPIPVSLNPNIVDAYYKIGPFKIGNDQTKTILKSDIILQDGQGVTIPRWHIANANSCVEIYYFTDSEGTRVNTLKENTEYYIRVDATLVADYDMNNIALETSFSFSANTAEFFVSSNSTPENDQVVAKINKEQVVEGDRITTEKPKYFDLSLRKFITKITRNGRDLSFDSRFPTINTNTLTQGKTNWRGETEYTATYTHPKNPLTVKNGDVVLYTIRIYNEGDITGRATQVTDYLPSGLKVKPFTTGDGSINDTFGWQVSEDGKTLTTDYLKTTDINPFKLSNTPSTATGTFDIDREHSTVLYYADLQVECIVEATPEDSLTNIAAITDDYNAEDKEDRDSVPENPGINDYAPDDYKKDATTWDDTYKQDDDDFERLQLETEFDLALRKYITKVERGEDEEKQDITIQNPRALDNINEDGLKEDTATTAEYKHRKDPVEVEPGDIVTYTFKVYNEGDIDGCVTSITDYLPLGLEFDEELNSDEYLYQVEDYKIDGKKVGTKLTIKAKESGAKLFSKIDRYDKANLKFASIDIKLRVTAEVKNEDQVLTNVATMVYSPIEGTTKDRDSNRTGIVFTEPTEKQLLSENETAYTGGKKETDLTKTDYHYIGQEDDDDFEKIIIKGKPFDLSLRKYINKILRNGKEVEFEDRTPSIDTTTLINGTFARNGKKEHTATYNHSKEPLVVKQGDIITYTLRIYNEGARDGYASEITDYIPEGLALIVNYKTNFDNKWKLPQDLEDSKILKLVGEDGFYKTEEAVKNFKLEDFENTESLKDVNLITGKVAITTNKLDDEDELIKAFDQDKTELEDGWQKASKGEGGLYYKDVEVSCLVIAENTYKETITNISAITGDKDEDGNEVQDRDSEPEDIKEPYTTWEQDDDDYEPVVLKYFDLALRKFITGVESAGNYTEIKSRIPEPKMGEDGNIKYEHTKDPVYVAKNDIVTYTIRVFNEGTIAGYAEEITDDLPEGLLYLPDNKTNKDYEWKMIDKDGNPTDDVEKAVKITTDYLSSNKETEDRTNLINPFDISKEISTVPPLNPDYKDVKIAFKVVEPSTSDRIITNKAQISEDSDDDEDSIPDEWNDGEDDQDVEHVYVKYFDLSLLKWVTKTIVTVDGKTTITETGFVPNTGKTETTGIRSNEAEEPIAKVELDRKKLGKTTVKFVYKIRVTNEGEIEGYATELTDFIPEGLEFLEEDNKAFGWTKKGDSQVTTRALETTLLKPGESAEVEIVFTWKNNADNLGLKTNIAEITEDYNEYDSDDIDSVPNNKKDPYEKEQEDDDDFALVILSLKTGKGVEYTIFITAMVSLLAGGIYLVKKYVLTY